MFITSNRTIYRAWPFSMIASQNDNYSTKKLFRLEISSLFDIVKIMVSLVQTLPEQPK